MNATLPASKALATPQRRRRGSITLPAWTHHLHLVSTGLLIVAVIALSFAAFGPNGIGGGGDNNGTGDGPGMFGAVPVATVPDDAQTSSIPYPTAEECTIEVTHDGLIADIQEANVATEPEQQRYERVIESSDEDAEAIMQTFREWQACGWDTQGFGFAYQMQLQTLWYTANHLPIFYNYGEGTIDRPVSAEEIEAYADVLLAGDETEAAEGVDATPPPSASTPVSVQDVPEPLPIPEGGTPVAAGPGGHNYLTIFAEDIDIIGPDTALARAYFVNTVTREVRVTTPHIYEFVKVDGQWLINDYREGGRG